MLEPSGSRTTSSAVTFVHPFVLGRDGRVLPAGTYMLHTQEDAYAGPLHAAYVAAGIDFEVHRAAGRTATRLVKPADLEAALARDLALSHEAAPGS